MLLEKWAFHGFPQHLSFKLMPSIMPNPGHSCPCFSSELARPKLLWRLRVFITVDLLCIKFLLASFLKECSGLLALYPVADETFTSVRNMEKEHGSVLEAVQSCPCQTLWCKFCGWYVQRAIGFLFYLQSNVGQKRMLLCSCSVLLPPTAPFLPPPSLCVSRCRNCWKGIQQGPLLSASSDYPKEKDLTRSSCLPRDLLSCLSNLTAVAIDGVQNNLGQWQKTILEEEFRSY